eukprot:4831152-Amphidinium_carterae.1
MLWSRTFASLGMYFAGRCVDEQSSHHHSRHLQSGNLWTQPAHPASLFQLLSVAFMSPHTSACEHCDTMHDHVRQIKLKPLASASTNKDDHGSVFILVGESSAFAASQYSVSTVFIAPHARAETVTPNAWMRFCFLSAL